MVLLIQWYPSFFKERRVDVLKLDMKNPSLLKRLLGFSKRLYQISVWGKKPNKQAQRPPLHTPNAITDLKNPRNMFKI